jgi:hypothetical protein
MTGSSSTVHEEHLMWRGERLIKLGRGTEGGGRYSSNEQISMPSSSMGGLSSGLVVPGRSNERAAGLDP